MGHDSAQPKTRGQARRLFIEAFEEWLGRALALVPGMTPEEQASLAEWDDRDGARTTDWPGWRGRMEPCPRALDFWPPRATRDWYVYRLRNAEGRLLYVGCSARPKDRLVRHQQRPWGSQIVGMEVERYASEADALAAEAAAIGAERPAHNVVGRR